MKGVLGSALFRTWLLPTSLPAQWPPAPPATPPKACLGLLPGTQLLLAGVTPTCLGPTCWVTSALGPGMHSELIVELFPAPGVLAPGLSLVSVPNPLPSVPREPRALGPLAGCCLFDRLFLRTPARWPSAIFTAQLESVWKGLTSHLALMAVLISIGSETQETGGMLISKQKQQQQAPGAT